MAYQITTTYTNGYRCSCCSRSWESSDWVDSLEEVLEQVPVELDFPSKKDYDDSELTRVSVIDGSTGEEVAWGRAFWSTGYGRYEGYSYTRWSGYRPDVGAFEVIYERGGKKIDRSWAEITDELKEKKRLQDQKEAERDLEDAQRRLKILSTG